MKQYRLLLLLLMLLTNADICDHLTVVMVAMLVSDVVDSLSFLCPHSCAET